MSSASVMGTPSSSDDPGTAAHPTQAPASPTDSRNLPNMGYQLGVVHIVYGDRPVDETARLALDYERGRSARVGYITNQPRTFGVDLNYKF